jgi:uncharacterized protein involved in exopolysaccharide biosynthesis
VQREMMTEKELNELKKLHDENVAELTALRKTIDQSKQIFDKIWFQFGKIEQHLQILERQIETLENLK